MALKTAASASAPRAGPRSTGLAERFSASARGRLMVPPQRFPWGTRRLSGCGRARTRSRPNHVQQLAVTLYPEIVRHAGVVWKLAEGGFSGTRHLPGHCLGHEHFAWRSPACNCWTGVSMPMRSTSFRREPLQPAPRGARHSARQPFFLIDCGHRTQQPQRRLDPFNGRLLL
jgi:hypothetical protein